MPNQWEMWLILCRSIGSYVNGAVTPLIEVPIRNLHSVPEAVSDEVASLAEPVACVTNSMFGQTAFVEPSFCSLIIWLGAIGLIVAQVAAL